MSQLFLIFEKMSNERSEFTPILACLYEKESKGSDAITFLPLRHFVLLQRDLLLR